MSGLYHVFEEIGSKTSASTGLRLVQDRSQGGACCSFVDIETEILCATWSEFAWLEAKGLMAKCSHRDVDGLEKLGCDGAPARGNCKGAQIERNVWDRARPQNSSVAEEERRAAPRANRTQQTLPCNLEKTESAEAGQNLIKTKESAETERAPKRTQSEHVNWSSIAKQENPETALAGFFQGVYSIRADQRDLTQEERTHLLELWENLRMDCAGGTVISETGESSEQSRDQISADVFKANVWKSWRDRCFVMCWDMNFPEEWLCSLTVMGPTVVCASRLSKFRPIAGLCAMRKILGYVWLKSLTPSTAVRECADGVCAEDARGCWLVLVVASGRTITRMAESNCGSASAAICPIPRMARNRRRKRRKRNTIKTKRERKE